MDPYRGKQPFVWKVILRMYSGVLRCELQDTHCCQAQGMTGFWKIFSGTRKNNQKSWPKTNLMKPSWTKLVVGDYVSNHLERQRSSQTWVEHFFNRSLHHITLTILQHAVYALGMAGTWRQQKVAKHRHKEPPQRVKTDRIDPHLEGDDFSFLMVIQSGETVNLHRRFH